MNIRKQLIVLIKCIIALDGMNSTQHDRMTRPAQSFGVIYEELLVYKHYSALHQMKIGDYLYVNQKIIRSHPSGKLYPEINWTICDCHIKSCSLIISTYSLNNNTIIIAKSTCTKQLSTVSIV